MLSSFYSFMIHYNVKMEEILFHNKIPINKFYSTFVINICLLRNDHEKKACTWFNWLSLDQLFGHFTVMTSVIPVFKTKVVLGRNR